ncbi:MAG: glutathione S-transferase family protein [Myxococcota bacterium]
MTAEIDREPVLHTARSAFGIPCASPFAIKADILLQMAGVSFTRAVAAPQDGPKGKLPWLVDGEETIADSSFIQAHLEQKHGADFDAGLSDEQRATSEMIRRVGEEYLYWAQVYFRWEDHPEMIREQLFAPVPAFFRGTVFRMVRRQVRRDLHGQGLGRHTREEILALTDSSVAALAALVGDRPFVHGDRPTSVDASLAGTLTNILAPETPSPLMYQVQGHPQLVAYERRLRARFPMGVAATLAAPVELPVAA